MLSIKRDLGLSPVGQDFATQDKVEYRAWSGERDTAEDMGWRKGRIAGYNCVGQVSLHHRQQPSLPSPKQCVPIHHNMDTPGNWSNFYIYASTKKSLHIIALIGNQHFTFIIITTIIKIRALDSKEWRF